MLPRSKRATIQTMSPGQAEKAMELYEQMLEEGVSADEHTFVSVFQACGMLGEEEVDAAEGGPIKVRSLATGKAVHADLMERSGHDHAGFVGNALVSMYAKCGSILDARSVFDSLHQRDVVSWTAMLAGYAQQGEAEKALELYGQMWHEGECVSPNEVTFATVLQACNILADKEDEEEVVGKRCLRVKALEVGRRIHDDARRTGHNTHVLVGNALVAMYGKCGSMEEAQVVLDGLLERSSSNAVAWTAMIAAHVRQGEWERALELYRHMQDDKGVSPNEVSLLCILQACSSSSSCSAGGILSICGHVQQSLLLLQEEHNQQPSLLLSTSLIHAYGRCGNMVDAQAVFDALTQPDVVAWTALIAGYARQGDCSATRRCYQEMQVSGNKPNGVTFLCLLYACSHAGLVDQGVEYLESMPRDHGLLPDMEHYTATVDLLARTGCFTMVGKLLSAMPREPDLALCLCLLSACRKHGQVVVGKRAFDAAIRLDPRRAAAYVLMFSIYADAGLWDRADEVRQLRLQAGAWKKRPGQSWIEHRDVMYTFSVADCDLKQEEQVHCLLGEMGAKAGGEW